jgi:hypothetical protein
VVSVVFSVGVGSLRDRKIGTHFFSLGIISSSKMAGAPAAYNTLSGAGKNLKISYPFVQNTCNNRRRSPNLSKSQAKWEESTSRRVGGSRKTQKIRGPQTMNKRSICLAPSRSMR